MSQEIDFLAVGATGARSEITMMSFVMRPHGCRLWSYLVQAGLDQNRTAIKGLTIGSNALNFNAIAINLQSRKPVARF
jgi:hypothetical protein